MASEKAVKSDAGRQDRVHVPFLYASLLLGVFGGFSLAVSLPIERAMGGFDVSWVSHAQVHGHLQVVGFAGLFVLGMSMRLSPRFGRGDLAFMPLVTPAFVLLVAGLLMRALGQPLTDHGFFAAMLVAGLAAELLAALAFVLIIGATLAPALRNPQPHAVLLVGAPVWLAVQAALGMWWLTDLARDGGTIVEHGRNTALVNLQFFGVVLSALLGVGMRSFPTFFGMPPTSRPLGLVMATLLHAGLAVWAGAAVIRVVNGVGSDTLNVVGSVGAALVGVSILLAVAAFGLGRRKHRLAAASRGFVFALQPVLAWLAFTGLALIWAGGRAAVEGNPIGMQELDAVRHVFAVGVITLAIVAMAQLMLPEFASERIVNPPVPWRGAAFGLALSAAAVLRGVLPWAGLAGDHADWGMALGGGIGIIAVAVFGYLYWRARRGHVAYTQRIAAMRARNTPITTVSS
ncbi:MAG: hypothetical protein M0R73_00295 [Dehalococcoidia bacterium]|nr:hypothetical protein [Dehalococcoidia bacterium]